MFMRIEKSSRLLALVAAAAFLVAAPTSRAQEQAPSQPAAPTTPEASTGTAKLSTPPTIIHHVVLKWKDDPQATDADKQKVEAQRQKVMDGLKEILATTPGVKNVWLKTIKVQPNDYSQNFVVEFENEAALEAYANHPKKAAWNDLYYSVRAESRNNVTTNEGSDITTVKTTRARNPFADDIANDLEQTGKKLVDLANAIPADKYDWRPSKDVRTVSQVFMHVTSTNVLLPPALGATPMAGVEIPKNPFELEKSWEANVTTKDEVDKRLSDSIAYAVQAVKAITADQFDAEIEPFGFKAPKRIYMLLLATHTHEHLGQAIAYARSIGVAPPWSQPEASQ
jgi:uncharacterized damage-inducible protein DinB